jgi:UDP-N-acetylmuramate:L-alanyl-gamma-D-glutamyl-meso-diaminopimelate ligase
MHIHILGICGTFMGGVAALAREAGHKVTGCDAGVYPPMSEQLRALGIELIEGFGADQLALAPDMFVVGNVVSRAHFADGAPKFPLMEAILDAGLPYTSGPQWLAEHVLQGRHVLAVAGTHGKTTTTSMLAWILHSAGLTPGFLVGGVPLNFGISARLGAQAPGQPRPLFVIEADEYDTAFFDKRSKFVHYRPRTAVLNNLEFDHADIFDDLAAIERQFHHLLRTVPATGRVVVNGLEESLARVLHQGCWSEVRSFGAAVSDFCAAGAPQAFDVLVQARRRGAWSGRSRGCTTSSTRSRPLRRRSTWACRWRRQRRRSRAFRTCGGAWSCAGAWRSRAAKSRCTTTSRTTPRPYAPRSTACAAS